MKLPFGLSRKRTALRIAIIGSCQTAGMAEAARRLLPDAEIKSWHIGVWPADTDDEILAQMEHFDLVISQVSDWDGKAQLRSEHLRNAGINALYVPTVVFTGFQPDVTYIIDGGAVIRGPGSDYHSILIAAAYALGVPEHRVADLFNAYVFAELGYLEVFQAAKTALVESFATAGFEIEPLFDDWLKVCGSFMYSMNHPNIYVLATVTRLALSRAGYIDATAPLPEGLEDNLATSFTAPVYQPIAKRLGLPGSSIFRRDVHTLPPGQTRDQALSDYVSASYQLYHGLGRPLPVSGAVAAACERLDGLLVR